MSRWRVIVDPFPGRGSWNMAVDDLLLREAEGENSPGAVLRLYRWFPPCLSLGYHQDYGSSCDPGYCRAAGFDIVRRPTGGKAVLHGDEVTYCVVAGCQDPPFEKLGLQETYDLVARALAAGLKRLGLQPSLHQRGHRAIPTGSAPCFLVPSRQELLLGGKKVVGSAQRRGRNAFLQHGAVPLSIDYTALAGATGQSAAEGDLYREAFAGLRTFRPGTTAEEVIDALRAGFGTAFPGQWEDMPLDEEERRRASAIERERYASPEWTRRAVEGAA